MPAVFCRWFETVLQLLLLLSLGTCQEYCLDRKDDIEAIALGKDSGFRFPV